MKTKRIWAMMGAVYVFFSFLLITYWIATTTLITGITGIVLFPAAAALSAQFFNRSWIVKHGRAGHEEEPIPERLRILLIAYASFIESQGWELVSRYYQHRLCDPQANLAMDPSRFTLGAMEECLRTAEAQGLLTREVSAEWTVDFFFRHFRGVVIDWALHQGSYSLLSKLEQDYALFERVFHA